MSNQELSQLFGRIASLMEIKEENHFKIVAYQRASESINTMTEDLSKLSQEELVQLPGIGQALAEKIVEFSQTGKLEFLAKLEEEVPPTLIDLLNVPAVGPKKAAQFWKTLGITTLAQLEEAAKTGKLRDLPGMGEKSESRILSGLQAQQHSQNRFPIHEAEAVANDWKVRISKIKGVSRLEIAGSLRRMRQTIGDLDLVGSAEDHGTVMEFFTSQPEVDDILSRGDLKSSIRLKSGIQIQLWLLPKEKFGSLLQFVTGSKDHNVRLREFALKRGLSLSERGFVTKDLKEILCGEEELVYTTLGLPFIPPEMREDRGEIETAAKNSLPKVISLRDIISDLHLHSNWSDGKYSLEDMANEAVERGLEMIALTDHTISAPTTDPTHRLAVEQIPARNSSIQKIQKKMAGKLIILNGIEVDILPDGQLDFPDEVLAQFDLVIASIHLEMNQSADQITQRLLSAIRNPWVDIIGHPSGRELPSNNGVELDWELLFQSVKENGTVLEVNSNPLHLDLDDIRARRAAESGILLAVNSDAHSLQAMGNLKYGIGTARRAWLTRDHVINTWGPDELASWLKKRKATARGR
jgi:DNA polymerase (family 10)